MTGHLLGGALSLESGILNEQVPGRVFQASCSYVVNDTGCTLNAATFGVVPWIEQRSSFPLPSIFTQRLGWQKETTTANAARGHADLETTLRYARPAAASERIAAVSEIKWYQSRGNARVDSLSRTAAR